MRQQLIERKTLVAYNLLCCVVLSLVTVAKTDKCVCSDELPAGILNCQQYKDKGECEAPWMLQGNYCCRTCQGTYCFDANNTNDSAIQSIGSIVNVENHVQNTDSYRFDSNAILSNQTYNGTITRTQHKSLGKSARYHDQLQNSNELQQSGINFNAIRNRSVTFEYEYTDTQLNSFYIQRDGDFFYSSSDHNDSHQTVASDVQELGHGNVKYPGNSHIQQQYDYQFANYTNLTNFGFQSNSESDSNSNRSEIEFDLDQFDLAPDGVFDSSSWFATLLPCLAFLFVLFVCVICARYHEYIESDFSVDRTDESLEDEERLLPVVVYVQNAIRGFLRSYRRQTEEMYDYRQLLLVEDEDWQQYFQVQFEQEGQQDQGRFNAEVDAQMDQFPWATFEERTKQGDCGICLVGLTEPLQTGDPALTLKCKHVFHKQCITQWVKTKGSFSQAKCPLCGAKIVETNELTQPLLEP